MTTTPLFDSIARRAERSVVPPIVPTGYSARPVARLTAVPKSAPDAEPVGAARIVPPALVAVIDAIPAAIGCPDARRTFDLADHSVSTVRVAGQDREVVAAIGDILIRRVVDSIEQELGTIDRRRAVVEVLGDRITQLVVDTIADELDRIDRDLEIPGA
ncbi:hypothetical protein [Curtobacterium sp. Leaf261]|uniref:hypothetical protein n=1 Tax=Curtobacterium sp. Leaf261 TaxID=1736311 RepID=UPI0006F4309E|nr:hypothetical protein [Curtobacterium sp. Leaf261]KQO60295.1 hypothetical protein ASF23_13770 [Curtobacterium sp. Leaf261]